MNGRHRPCAQALALGSFFAFGLAIFVCCSGSATPRHAQEARPAPPGAISVAQLMGEYEGNSLAADHKYKGRIVVVFGMVTEVSQRSGVPYVRLGEFVGDISCAHCVLEPKDTPALLQLRAGEYASVRGRCERYYMLDVILRDCVLQ